MLNRGHSSTCAMPDIAYTGRSTPITAFDGLILCFHITGTLEIRMKEFDAEKVIFDKMAALCT